MSSESERPACPNCGAIPSPAARGATLAFCAACDIAYSHEGMIVAAGLRSFPRLEPSPFDLVDRVGRAFYKAHRVYPSVYKMHPEFFARLRLDRRALTDIGLRDGHWHFKGILIEQTQNARSVEACLRAPDGTHRGAGHQRRKRTIDGVRIDEQEYPDGSVTVFIDNEYFAASFEDAVKEIEARGKEKAHGG